VTGVTNTRHPSESTIPAIPVCPQQFASGAGDDILLLSFRGLTSHPSTYEIPQFHPEASPEVITAA
jgi:hypothetical protein